MKKLIVLLIVIAVLFMMKGYKSFQIKPVELFCGFISLNVFLAPVAEEHHYILFIPLIIILCKILYENPNVFKIEIMLSVIFFIILMVPFNYKFLQDSQFPFSLVAYLKLFSGIGLLVLFKKALFKQTANYQTA